MARGAVLPKEKGGEKSESLRWNDLNDHLQAEGGSSLLWLGRAWVQPSEGDYWQTPNHCQNTRINSCPSPACCGRSRDNKWRFALSSHAEEVVGEAQKFRRMTLSAAVVSIVTATVRIQVCINSTMTIIVSLAMVPITSLCFQLYSIKLPGESLQLRESHFSAKQPLESRHWL